jgi:hypothetical protein
MRITLCAIGRMENRYAREWVDYHLSIGFDHIYICDNNRVGEEHFEEVIGDYVKEGRVTILNFRNMERVQIRAYNKCYALYGGTCDWMAFLDFDEYLVTSKPLQEFLTGREGMDCVLVNWRVMTDSGLVSYDARPVRERFTVPLDNHVLMRGKHRYNDHVKSIVRGGLGVNTVFDNSMHVPKMGIRCCTANGNTATHSPFHPCDHSIARIDHYTTKTLEEWLTVKMVRGLGQSDSDRWRQKIAIKQFFEINSHSPEKDKMVAEWAADDCP